MGTRILIGHVLDRLAGLPNGSVHCVVTSPPYFGLRDYGIDPQVWGGRQLTEGFGSAWRRVQCEHEWGDDVRAPWANSVPGPAARKGGSNPGKMTTGARNETKSSG